MADLKTLADLAERNPAALSPDGWQRLHDAGVSVKAVSYPPEMIDETRGWLRHPSGYMVSGPGSADVIRSALGQQGGGSTGSSALDLCLRRYKRFYNMPPLRLWRGPEGDVEASEAVPKDAIYSLLRKPNADLTLRDIRGLIVACEFVEGNAYLVKLRAGGGTILDNVRGMVEALHPVDPTRMRPMRDKGSSNLIDYYALDLGEGKAARVPRENVIHFRDELDPRDPNRGLGVVKRLVREVSTDAEADAFVATYMRNMGIPGLVFAPKELSKAAPIDPEQLQSYVAASTTGANRGKPLVFKVPVDFFQMTASTRVLDLSHVSARIETRIAGMVGIPAVLAGLAAGLDATSYGANARALVEAFIENELMAIWAQHGERWTIGLRADFGLADDQWLGYDWTGLRALADDEDAKARRWGALWAANAITLGQLHDALDMALPKGADENARAADFARGGSGGEAGGDVIDMAPVGALPAPAPSGAGMSAARLEVLQRLAERVAAGGMTVEAAAAQIVFGFGVDDATARRLIGQAVAVVEDGGEVAKAMRPFGRKAERWKPPGDGDAASADDLTLSPEDIETLADEAVDDWREWLSEGDDSDLADVLDTTPADHGRESRRRGKASLGWMAKARDRQWAWDPKAQRYRWPNTGRPLPLERVKGARDRRIDEARARMQQAAQAMIDGKLTVKQWQKVMRDESARAHLEMRMLGVGGKANMTRADYQWVHDRVKREAGYLADFGKAVRAGELSEAGILDRAGKYAGATLRDAYADGATDAHAAAGFTHKRRVGADDERTCDPCRKEITAGWVPIGRDGWIVGDTECQSQDRCDIEFEKR